MNQATNKDLFIHLCLQMELLSKKKVSVDEAKAQASLAKQANNMLRYELDRIKTEMKIHQYNEQNKTNFSVREIENGPQSD